MVKSCKAHFTVKSIPFTRLFTPAFVFSLLVFWLLATHIARPRRPSTCFAPRCLDGGKRQPVRFQHRHAAADLFWHVCVAARSDGFFPFLRQLARHGVGAFVLAVGTAVPDLDAVKSAHHIVEPVRVCAVLKGMRDDRQPALCVNGRDRLGKLPRFDGFSHKETQQMPALGRNLGRGDDEKIVEFRNLVQHAVVVADGDTVQPALARKRNDLAQAHAAIERPLGMNVQIEPQLHDPLPFLSAQTGSF